MNGEVYNIDSEIQLWLGDVLEKEKIKNPTVRINSNTGNFGLTGDIIFVNTKGITEEGKAIEKDFAVKIEKNGAVREQYPVKEVFERELYVYEEIMPAFLELQCKNNIQEKFESLPKYYGSPSIKNVQAIILENVKRLGYETVGFKLLNLNHIKLIFNELGKFNALSFALRDQDPEKFQKITRNLKPILPLEMKENLNIVKTTQKMFKESYKVFKDDNAVLEKLKMLENDVPYLLALPDDCDDYSAICHLDLQILNLFFKYQDEHKEEPTSMIFIDWQLAQLSSPVCDLAFLLHGSSENILEHLSELQEIYYNSLSNFLEQLGSDVKKLYPYEIYMDHWKKYSKFGLAMVFLTLKLLAITPEELPVMVTRTFEKIGDFFDCETKNVEMYQNRLKLIVKHFIDQGFL